MNAGYDFPTLSEPYSIALGDCVASVLKEFDVLAILVSGTIVRGTGDRRSDLDIQVLHRGTFRQRLQVWHHGVPCEIFVNPPSRIARYFEEELAGRRPITAHMFSTGHIIYDPDGVGARLKGEAQHALASPPPRPSLEERKRICYGPASQFEDALDLFERDPDAGAILLSLAVFMLVECRFLCEPGWLPRPKDCLALLRDLDPHAARLAMAATIEPDLSIRFEAGRELCRIVTGQEGFFEWSSNREEAV